LDNNGLSSKGIISEAMMKFIKKSFVIILLFFSLNGLSQNLGEEYIDAWRSFYPSVALSRGMHGSIFNYEDFSAEKINSWLVFNAEMLEEISDPGSAYAINNYIDARLLKVQLQSEIDKWEKEKPHQNKLSLYASMIRNPLEAILNANFLTAPEKSRLICQRLNAVERLCNAAMTNLKEGNTKDVEIGLQTLSRAERFFNEELSNAIDARNFPCSDFNDRREAVLTSIRDLISFVKLEIEPIAGESSPILGRNEYTRRLALYTDSELTPETLAEMALEEIELVRGLMGNVSKEYLISQNIMVPKSYNELVDAALSDMQKDVPTSASDYLEFWQNLSDAAEAFLVDKEIATLPKNKTLRIMTAPESAGPAARIGWVASAPPFDPNPMTTLYLPSIPETLPKQEQLDFWASFNKPFNRIIVIHELFPGHYMQMKISRESPHPIRLLYPYGIYTEGWATFCERVALDAGWEEGNHMSMLAHLRKRLENANRAYTSVQVHTNGWTQDQVMKFSTETSLVAPQFAKSLWGRLMRSPMQLTSYFLGGSQFTSLLEAEKERLGDAFNLRIFMDTIMLSGPIPIDEFYGIFKNTVTQ
jgi:hypothetical protein